MLSLPGPSNQKRRMLEYKDWAVETKAKAEYLL